MVREFIDAMPARLDHYQMMAMDNSILKQRTVDIGSYSTQEAPGVGHYRRLPARHRHGL